MITSLQEAETPPARTIVRELRRLRRGHSDRSVWQALEQGYLWAFGLLMVGSISGAALARVWSELGRCTSGGCAGDPTTLVALLGVAGFVLVVRGLSSFGPVVASRATATWLLSSPVDRGGLLRGRVYGILGTAAVVGGGVLGSVAALMVLGTDPRSAAGAGIGPG
ncbi:MAG TPA: DUF6297 family protein, partial [Actinopolymorphaceae bacterium]